MPHDNSTNIKYGVGEQIRALRDTLLRRDYEAFAEQTDLFVTIAIPYIRPEDEPDYELPELEYDPTPAQVNRFYRKVRTIQRRVLRLLAKHNIYAWTAPQEGDATSLAAELDPSVAPDDDAAP